MENHANLRDSTVAQESWCTRTFWQARQRKTLIAAFSKNPNPTCRNKKGNGAAGVPCPGVVSEQPQPHRAGEEASVSTET